MELAEEHYRREAAEDIVKGQIDDSSLLVGASEGFNEEVKTMTEKVVNNVYKMLIEEEKMWLEAAKEADEIFKRADKDLDGVLTYDEAEEALKEAVEAEEMTEDQAKEYFEELKKIDESDASLDHQIDWY